jgi:DNA-binding response OmpR family regulator
MAGPTPTVLVVEDDPVILQLLEVNFEMEGFSVITAADGALGYDQAVGAQPDIIVTDIMMPNVSGLDMLRQLRSNPDTKGIPVILLSAKAQTSDIQTGTDAGADAYVTKPFEPLDLVDKVNALLRR